MLRDDFFLISKCEILKLLFSKRPSDAVRHISTKQSNFKIICLLVHFVLCLLILFYKFKVISIINFICYSPKESSLKNSTRGPFGFECLSFTFCYLDFILTPYDPCPLLWWVGGWVGGAYFCSDLPHFLIY